MGCRCQKGVHVKKAKIADVAEAAGVSTSTVSNYLNGRFHTMSGPTKEKIEQAIARLVEGKTVIMIAHRLRTVVDADQILVLNEGELMEQGTHKELLEQKGLYSKLFYIQQESLGWSV